MACGTPVLGFDRGAVPEVVEHGVSGFVVEAVEAMAEDVGRLEPHHRLASRERVKRLFSAEVVAEGYLTVYGQLLHEALR